MNAPVPVSTMLPKASLYFTGGGSDKEYHAEVVAKDGGYVCNFRYGRRGSSMTCGCKTPAPVDFEEACKVFSKLVKEKTSKGYSPEEGGVAYQSPELAGRKTDFVPQLLNSITEEDAMRLIHDDEWVAQEKYDGERRAAHATSDEAVGMNRKGLAVPLPLPVVEQLRERSSNIGTFRVDSESIGDKLYVFDLLIDRGESCKKLGLGFLERMTLARQSVSGCANIIAIPVAIGTKEKQALFDRVKANKGEGLVFKRRNAPITEGKPNSGGDMLKFKFVERATVQVGSISGTKRSIGIDLFDEEGEVVHVGNCTSTCNYDIPNLNDLVDVDYLYAYRAGSLYQPVYRGVRTDLDVSACSTSQLKYKPEGGDDDEDQ